MAFLARVCTPPASVGDAVILFIHMLETRIPYQPIAAEILSCWGGKVFSRSLHMVYPPSLSRWVEISL